MIEMVYFQAQEKLHILHSIKSILISLLEKINVSMIKKQKNIIEILYCAQIYN